VVLSRHASQRLAGAGSDGMDWEGETIDWGLVKVRVGRSNVHLLLIYWWSARGGRTNLIDAVI